MAAARWASEPTGIQFTTRRQRMCMLPYCRLFGYSHSFSCLMIWITQPLTSALFLCDTEPRYWLVCVFLFSTGSHSFLFLNGCVSYSFYLSLFSFLFVLCFRHFVALLAFCRFLFLPFLFHFLILFFFFPFFWLFLFFYFPFLYFFHVKSYVGFLRLAQLLSHAM